MTVNESQKVGSDDGTTLSGDRDTTPLRTRGPVYGSEFYTSTLRVGGGRSRNGRWQLLLSPKLLPPSTML